jgi:excisionase family DNA binding protein
VAHEQARTMCRLVAIDEVAAMLGVSVRHVRRLVSERRIPFIKWGHLLRFDVDELSEWISAARDPTRSASVAASGGRRPLSTRGVLRPSAK